MTKDKLVLANQLHNHLECCKDLDSQIEHALHHHKDPEGIDWNRLMRPGIEDGILGHDMIRQTLLNLRQLVAQYAQVVEKELSAL